MPQLPAELILMPSNAMINIYAFSSWAHLIIVPLLILNHHQPVFELPNGKMTDNDSLDEIWCDPTNKTIPYIGSYAEIWKSGGITFAFAVFDKLLVCFGGLRKFFCVIIPGENASIGSWNVKKNRGIGTGFFPACISAF